MVDAMNADAACFPPSKLIDGGRPAVPVIPIIAQLVSLYIR